MSPACNPFGHLGFTGKSKRGIKRIKVENSVTERSLKTIKDKILTRCCAILSVKMGYCVPLVEDSKNPKSENEGLELNKP